jgi:hypothetical protein
LIEGNIETRKEIHLKFTGDDGVDFLALMLKIATYEQNDDPITKADMNFAHRVRLELGL